MLGAGPQNSPSGGLPRQCGLFRCPYLPSNVPAPFLCTASDPFVLTKLVKKSTFLPQYYMVWGGAGSLSLLQISKLPVTPISGSCRRYYHLNLASPHGAPSIPESNPIIPPFRPWPALSLTAFGGLCLEIGPSSGMGAYKAGHHLIGLIIPSSAPAQLLLVSMGIYSQ